jgi:hypothetical protein
VGTSQLIPEHFAAFSLVDRKECGTFVIETTLTCYDRNMAKKCLKDRKNLFWFCGLRMWISVPLLPA